MRSPRTRPTSPPRSASPSCPRQLAPALQALRGSEIAARVLGPEIVAAISAVRTWELEHHGSTSPDELPARFRFAWSI